MQKVWTGELRSLESKSVYICLRNFPVVVWSLRRAVTMDEALVSLIRR